MQVYGLTGTARTAFEQVVLDQFHYAPRPDAQGFSDGDVFDLGGGVTVEAVHLPGHTRGHSGFRMDGVFFLSDIDLTGFGPYYGDVWSDLEDFEASLAKVRDEEADFYVTFHHKGVIEGRETFVDMVGPIPTQPTAVLDSTLGQAVAPYLANYRVGFEQFWVEPKGAGELNNGSQASQQFAPFGEFDDPAALATRVQADLQAALDLLP